MIIDLKNLSAVAVQNYLQQVVAPRPICLASTIDITGRPNLSPFSFFNLFSANPPIVIFSPARRVRDNTTKHTLENVLAVPEVVIHICDYEMVQQINLTSAEFTEGVNEFIKAGFTEEPATLVKPPMVKEAKIKMECSVIEIKPLGRDGGAGNLVICEVLRLHIDNRILGADGCIDLHKIKLVARLGGDWYYKVDRRNLFTVVKPARDCINGIDALPARIRNSPVFTKSHLAQLANTDQFPNLPATIHPDLFYRAKKLLDKGLVAAAWEILQYE